jgi:O-Antigen ligase/Tetratricopeptide repeat
VHAVRAAVGRIDPSVLISGAVAIAVFWIAYDDASHGLPARSTIAIVVWWAVILALALQLVTPLRVPRATLVVGGLLAAFAGWTLASILWAPSAEDAFNEFNRVSLYLGVYVLVVLVSSRRTVGRWADALAVGITAIAVVALVSRLIPDSFSDRGLAAFLPSAVTRLSFPLGYWNGLASFAALGVPLLLRVALVGRSTVVRSLAVAPIPVIAAVIYLTSSRGGVLTALVGAAAFVALTEGRWTAVGAIAAAGAGSAAAVGVLLVRDELVNGPLGTDLVRDQGRGAGALIAIACVGAAIAYWLGCRFLAGGVRIGPNAGRAAAVGAGVALLALVVASDPISRFDTFRTPPPELEQIDPGDFVTTHLLSGGGSGRWQFWSAAVDQSGENVFVGEGAGSYEHWWSEHASFAYFIRDAHSLYVEVLGELGLVGLGLVLALVVAGIVFGVRRALRTRDEERTTLAAVTAVVAAFAVAAGVDWMWELTAVSVVGFTALALTTGPATEIVEPLRPARAGESGPWPSRRRFGIGVAAALVAWLLIVAQAIPLLADREIARSQEAVEQRDLDDALDAAETAQDIQPWASTPYLQLALVVERQGDLSSARAWIGEAIERDERDWQLWLVAARIQTKLGDISAAEQSLLRAIELNPRSPLFAGLLGA